MDGSVSIFKAGVAAGSRSCHHQSDPATDPAVATVWASIPGQKQKLPFRGTVYLKKWLDSFRPTADKYAIVLFKKMRVPQKVWFYRGVLIERVYRRTTREFVSVGVFEITQNEGGVNTWPGIREETLDICVL